MKTTFIATVLTALATSVVAAEWKTTVSLAARGGYDSNVFLQNSSPAPAMAGAVLPRVGSIVADLSASVGFEGPLTPVVKLAASYSPDAEWYLSEPGENHVTHRASLLFTAGSGHIAWSWQTSATRIDGANESPIFGCEGGATAIGGIPLRDRRDAFIGRSAFKLTYTGGPWFVRPIATAYLHNFLTRQSRVPGYENYIDRSEYVGGADLGRRVCAQSRVYLGYRCGRQNQCDLFGVESPYDWNLQRFLAGFEGTPAGWLKLNLLAGPEVRRAAHTLPAGCDTDRTIWWLDASATLTPGSQDSIVLSARRYAQPSFASLASYIDITYECSWRHVFGQGLTASAGYKAYGGKWIAPAVRSDWILTPSAGLSYSVSPRLSLEANWSRDAATSCVPAKPGREYVRHLTCASGRYMF